jgi:hypothetical protein
MNSLDKISKLPGRAVRASKVPLTAFWDLCPLASLCSPALDMTLDPPGFHYYGWCSQISDPMHNDLNTEET